MADVLFADKCETLADLHFRSKMCGGRERTRVNTKQEKSNSTWLDLLHAEVWLMGRLLLLLLLLFCIKHCCCCCCCCSAENTVVVVVAAAADNVTTLIFTLTAAAAAAAEFMKQKNHDGMKEKWA
jgi:hypothetical protein